MAVVKTGVAKAGTRKEWLEARVELLGEEKELTRRSDDLARRRQELPWVVLEKDYQFETEQGLVSLGDLFEGRSQLMIYHFMFGPEYEAGCPSCSAIADGFNGIAVHLAQHDVTLMAVSRAPIERLRAYRERMGWTFPWASSLPGDFNADFNVYFTEEQQFENGIEYNYRREPTMSRSMQAQPVINWKMRGAQAPVEMMASMTGTNVATYTRDRPGVSAFALDEGVIYHTYSTYGRGLDVLWGMYCWLDRAPLGRNETGIWWRRHDEYGV